MNILVLTNQPLSNKNDAIKKNNIRLTLDQEKILRVQYKSGMYELKIYANPEDEFLGKPEKFKIVSKHTIEKELKTYIMK